MLSALIIVFCLVVNCNANESEQCEEKLNKYHKGKYKNDSSDHEFDRTLFLVYSRADIYHKLRTKMFSELAEQLGFEVIVYDSELICPDDLKATQALAKRFPNVINLKATVPRNYDDALLPSVGYIGEVPEKPINTTVRICTVNVNGNVRESYDDITDERDNASKDTYNNSTEESHINIAEETNNKVTEGTFSNGINGTYDNAIVTEKKTYAIEKKYSKVIVETYNNTCKDAIAEVVNHNYVYVKLASKSIENYNILYQVLLNFSFWYNKHNHNYWNRDKNNEKPIKSNSILICSNLQINEIDGIRRDIQSNSKIPDRRVDISFVDKCTSVESFREHNLKLALIEKPLLGEEITHLPVVFYNIPYLLPEHKDIYPNGMVVYKIYFETLIMGIINLLNTQRWSRVAIVSDDSPYSDDFGEKLQKKFFEKGVLYINLHWPEDSSSKEVVESLRDNVVMVILNVAEHNIETVMQEVIRKSRGDYMWIFRDWPADDTHLTELVQIMRNARIYSMSVGPDKHVFGRSHIAENIGHAMGIIYQALISGSLEKTVTKRIQAEIDRVSDKRLYIINIRQITHGNPVVFSDVITAKRRTKAFINDIKHRDVYESCQFKGSRFDNPCEDNYILAIISIFLVLLILLLITYIMKEKYWNRRRPRSRYYKSL